MSPKNFINKVKEYLNLADFEKSSKKKSVKSLLKKLRTKRKEIKQILQDATNPQEIEALTEELEIVCMQIKKGKKILNELKK
jgi:fibrillarin-like rRNA methylase